LKRRGVKGFEWQTGYGAFSSPTAHARGLIHSALRAGASVNSTCITRFQLNRRVITRSLPGTA
jgi:hypothetical protein